MFRKTIEITDVTVPSVYELKKDEAKEFLNNCTSPAVKSAKVDVDKKGAKLVLVYSPDYTSGLTPGQKYLMYNTSKVIFSHYDKEEYDYWVLEYTHNIVCAVVRKRINPDKSSENM